MKSLLAQLADDQFAACQMIAALARDKSATPLPVSALAQLLFLDEAELHELFGSHMTASQAVTYARTGPTAHLLTFIHDEGVKANG